MLNSIKWRLTLVCLLLVTLSLAVLGTVLLTAMENYFLRETEESLVAHARVFSHYAELTFLGNDLAQQFGEDVDAHVQILDSDGVVVGDSLWPDAPLGERLDTPLVESALAGEVESEIHREEDRRERFMRVVAPLRAGGNTIGAVHLTTSLAGVDADLATMRWFFLVGLGVALVVTTSLGFYLAGTLTVPLRELTQAAGLVARGDFNQRLVPRGGEELEQVMESFNFLTEKLDSTIAEISGERKKLSAVMTSMGDGLVAVDSHMRGLLFNPAAVRMFGVPRDQVISQPLSRVLDFPPLERLFREVLDQGQTLVDEMEPTRQPGTIVKAQVSPIKSEDGRHWGAVAVLRDITDLRRLEEHRLEFLSNASHELRTPLTTIKGFAVTLADEFPADSPARHYIQVIEDETDRLTRLVGELLDLSRMDALQLSLEVAAVDVQQLVASCMQQMLPAARQNGVSLESRIDTGLPRVLADPDRLRQVLINLLDNALKFTPAGGRVTVAGGRQGDELWLAVEDTGVGIPAEDLPHITERFYRVDKARSRSQGGTGLGLSIVKWLVEQHGGQLQVESVPEEGSTFTVRLPLIVAEPDSAGTGAAPGPNNPGAEN